MGATGSRIVYQDNKPVERTPAEPEKGNGPGYVRWDATEDLYIGFQAAPHVKTMWDLLVYAQEQYGDKDFLGKRKILDDALGTAGEYEYTTYAEFFDQVKTFASGLEKLGLLRYETAYNEMKLLGICSPNRMEWLVAEYACFALGGTTVPFYTTYNSEQFQYACDLSEVTSIVCTKKIAEILCSSGAKTLKDIVLMDNDFDDEMKNRYAEKGITLHGYSDVLKIGKENLLSSFPGSKADGIFSFVWTSGTTGFPKGALIKHSSMQVNCASTVNALQNNENFNLDEIMHFSYLPVEHAMERAMLAVLMGLGGKAGFFRGDRLLLMEDLIACRPTLFVSVPRMLNKIFDKVMAGVDANKGSVKAKLFKHALAVKTKNLRKGYYKHSLWDKIIFNKIAAKLGLDRVQSIATGSAPIDAKVLDFLSVVFSCPVVEGYGQTEVTCGCSGTEEMDPISQHVGFPGQWAEIRLQSVPEMGYLYTDTKHGSGESEMDCLGRGEVLVRGPCTFREYYKQKEKTDETLVDGWVHTGDIGIWLPGHRLKIVDRKKNIYKLSFGEYIAPEKIEQTLMRSPLIAQLYVHGDSLEAFLVAIVCPDPDFIIPWAIENKIVGSGVALDDMDALKTICSHPKANEVVLESIRMVGKAGKLLSYEIPKQIFLRAEQFSDQDCLTATMKLQRNRAAQAFGPIIKELIEKEKSKSK